MRSASSLKGRFQCEKPVSALFCRAEKLFKICDSVTEKAKYGKMRQVNAVKGCQTAEKTGVDYYRGMKRKTEIN